MAGDRRFHVLGFLLSFFFLWGLGLWAQDSDEENAEVGQTLTWEGSGDALRYELIIENASGAEVHRQSVETTTVDLKLKPGNYRYRVLVYNLLDQVDIDTSWEDLVVLRAEIPGPKVVTPGTQYLENPVFKFKVEGILLVEGAKYTLFRPDRPEISTVATVNAHLSDQEVELSFPDFEFVYGDYDLTIENPGGLKHTLKNALKVRYDKPFDLRLSAGLSPMVLLWDSWFKSTWDKVFYPLGANARVQFVFLKKGEFQLGAEVESNGWLQTGGTDQATIHSRYLTGGLNFVYTWILNKTWRLSGRVGGGMMAADHTFDYQGTQGSSWASLDPYVGASVGGMYFITKFWFVETGVGVINGFANGYMAGYVQPTVTTGLIY